MGPLVSKPHWDSVAAYVPDDAPVAFKGSAEAITAGGSTLQDFAHTDGASGEFQQRFLVYDREGKPCMNCGAPIERLVQSGRSTFYCRHCQR